MNKGESVQKQAQKWHTLTAEDVFELLKTHSQGLSKDEIARRLKEYGYNELFKRGGTPEYSCAGIRG